MNESIESQPTTACRRPSLLIVDDNRDMTQSLPALFEMSGYGVVTAHSGAGALDQVDRETPAGPPNPPSRAYGPL